MTQLALFEAYQGYQAYQQARCDCGGMVRYYRTRDRFEDVWTCDRCSAHGSVSWSREFGPRVAEGA